MQARYRVQLEAAKAALGSKYLLHPDNHVQKLAKPLILDRLRGRDG